MLPIQLRAWSEIKFSPTCCAGIIICHYEKNHLMGNSTGWWTSIKSLFMLFRKIPVILRAFIHADDVRTKGFHISQKKNFLTCPYIGDSEPYKICYVWD